MLGKINWRPQKRDIRYFAVTLAIVAVLLGVVVLASSTLKAALVVAGCGVALALLCYFVIPLGKAIYLLWMAVSFVLNWIISPIVIAVIYYLVLTPIGLFYKITGRDELHLKRPDTADSYFNMIDEEITPDEFKRQF